MPWCRNASDAPRHAVRSVDVPDVSGQTDPGVPAYLVHRYLRRREPGIREYSHRHAHHVGDRVRHEVHRGAALQAEVEAARAAFVSGAHVLVAASADRHRLRREPGLHRERAAGAALAGEAMSDGDAQWLAFGHPAELATAVFGGAPWHGSCLRPLGRDVFRMAP